MKYRRVILVSLALICVGLCLGYSVSDPLDSQNSATSPEKRMKAWAHHQKLKEDSPFKDLKWRAVGPELQGGRIEAIACHPDEPFTK